MKATTRFRRIAGAFCMLIGINAMVLGQVTGRLELSSPDYDLFTPTDWIDVTSFTLKERIPAGITGYIYTNMQTSVYLHGVALRGNSKLATFTAGPIDVRQQTSPGSGEYVYTLQLGQLSSGADFPTDYLEHGEEVDKLKDEIQSGVASLTGRFTVRVYLRDFALRPSDDVESPTALAVYTRDFDIPFSTPDQAKIQLVVNPMVSTPNPLFSIILPPERPNLEYELSVHRLAGNSVEDAISGPAIWRETYLNGETFVAYPPDASPLTSGEGYVLAGRSLYQSSSSMSKLSVEAEPQKFTYQDPSESSSSTTDAQSSGSSTSTPGESATRPDPLLTIFGASATQLPPDLVQTLTPILEDLQVQGWTLTEFRYNNRRITSAELAALLDQFANATVTVQQ